MVSVRMCGRIFTLCSEYTALMSPNQDETASVAVWSSPVSMLNVAMQISCIILLHLVSCSCIILLQIIRYVHIN